MSQEIELEGKQYISSKRASELTGYAQDYIGQLARKSLIEARRIGGLWYVSLEALLNYKQNAENFKPEPPVRDESQDPSSLVFLDGKEYFSAARAADVTGYHSDYVGQLARSGAIQSKQIGNRWYVEKTSIADHKKEKDALLAAVQAESVGLKRPLNSDFNAPKYVENTSYSGSGPLLNYTTDEGDLLPVMAGSDEAETTPSESSKTVTESESPVYSIPIRKVRYSDMVPERPVSLPIQERIQVQRPTEPVFARASMFPVIAGGLATIVIVLSVGYMTSLKANSAYATNIIRGTGGSSAFAASAEAAFGKIGDFLEKFLTRELVYTRTSN